MEKGPVLLSYAWGDPNERIAANLHDILSARGLRLVRDKVSLSQRGKARAFVLEHGDQARGVFLLSLAYLRSANCLSDLLWLSGRPDDARRFHVLALSEADPHDPRLRDETLALWSQKQARLDQKLSKLPESSMFADLREQAALTAQLVEGLRRWPEVLEPFRLLGPRQHQDADFSSLVAELAGLG